LVIWEAWGRKRKNRKFIKLIDPRRFKRRGFVIYEILLTILYDKK